MELGRLEIYKDGWRFELGTLPQQYPFVLLQWLMEENLTETTYRREIYRL